MDGVVVDSEPIHAQALAAACHQLGLRADSELPDYRGRIEPFVAADILARNAPTTVTPAQFIACKQDAYERIAAQRLKPMAGAEDFLLWCSHRRYRLGLVTSGLRVNAEMVLRRFGLDHWFEVVVTGDDVTEGKPHPEPYHKAAARLGIAPAACVVIEDSLNGVLSGKAAGCFTVALATTFSRQELTGVHPDLIIGGFAEIMAGQPPQ
jgi:HAD superfamily hydrolase (TIGR01509 family)